MDFEVRTSNSQGFLSALLELFLKAEDLRLISFQDTFKLIEFKFS